MRTLNIFSIIVLFLSQNSFANTEYKATTTYGGFQHDTGWLCTSAEHACNTLYRSWVPQEFSDQYRSLGAYPNSTSCAYQSAASVNADGDVNWGLTSIRGNYEVRNNFSCDFDNTEEDECPHPYYKYEDDDGIDVCTSPCEYFRFQNPNETHLTSFYPDSFLALYGETQPLDYVCDYLIDGVACEFVRDLYTHVDSPEPGFLTDYNLTGNECKVGEWGEDNPAANPDPGNDDGGCTVVCFGNCADICAEVDGEGVLDDFDGLSDPEHESVQDDPDIPIICYYIPTAPGCPGTSTDANGDGSGDGSDDGGDGSGDGSDDGSGDSGTGNGDSGTGTGTGTSGTGTGTGTDTGTDTGDSGTSIGDLDFGNQSFSSPGIFTANTMSETNSIFYDRLTQAPIYQMSVGASQAWPTGGTCPIIDFQVFGTSITTQAHCQIFTSMSGLMASAMSAIWVIFGIVIILRA